MSLPSGYRQVEYIESTGTQYIDTHYVPNANTRFVVDTQFRDVPSGGTMYMMGLASISSTSCRCAFGMGYINNKTEWYFGIGDVNNDTNITPDTDRHTFYVDVYEKKGMLDDVVYNTGTTFTSYNAPAYLFARNKNSIGEKCKCKLYGASFAEHDGDTVVAVHEYIPVVREQDEKPGLYDTVADAFLTNNGTGEFLWEEIPENMYIGVANTAQEVEQCYIGISSSIDIQGYEQLHYIEGSQWGDGSYIELDVIPSTGYGFEMSGRYLAEWSDNTGGSIFDNSGSSFRLDAVESYSRFCRGSTVKYHVFTLFRDYQHTRMNDFVCSCGVSTYKDCQGKVGSINNDTFTSSNPIRVYPEHARVYYLKIFDGNSQLVAHIVPVKRQSDDVLGFYDIVSDTFYENEGEGYFVGEAFTPQNASIARMVKKVYVGVNGVAQRVKRFSTPTGTEVQGTYTKNTIDGETITLPYNNSTWNFDSIIMDLGQVYDIKKIVEYARTSGGGSYEFQASWDDISCSIDGEKWYPIVGEWDVWTPTHNYYGNRIIDNCKMKARYIRTMGIESSYHDTASTQTYFFRNVNSLRVWVR